MATMKRAGSIYPWTPFWMISSFLTGTILAVGHHLFYQSLEGKPTSKTYQILKGTQYGGQELTVAIGTGFAFLIRAAFMVSGSMAFYQLFWRVIKQGSDSRVAAKLKAPDVVSSSPTNNRSMLNILVRLKYPLFFVLGATAWIIPLASFITPGALSIALRENISTIDLQEVPQIDFQSFNFLASLQPLRSNHMGEGTDMSDYNSSFTYIYNGPSSETKEVAMKVAAENTVADIVPSFPNSTWDLEFHGPSLKCDRPITEYELAINTSLMLYITENCLNPPVYLSWFQHVLDDPVGQSTVWPYTKSTDTNNFTDVNFTGWPSLFKTNQSLAGETSNMTFFVVALPGMMKANQLRGRDNKPICVADFEVPDHPIAPSEAFETFAVNSTILQCRLYNSTYRTRFSYTNGVQIVDIDLVETEKDSAITTVNQVRGPGMNGGWGAQCATINSAFPSHAEPCFYNGSTVAMLTYSAVLEAFTSLITGSITRMFDPFGLFAEPGTGILSTDLVNTKELYFLTDQGRHTHLRDGFPDLQAALHNSDMSEVTGMLGVEQQRPNRTLSRTIEEMFQKYVVSLMSSPLFLQNYSSTTTRPEKALVTQYRSENFYSYSASRLWLAYGLATAFTLMSVIIGLLVIFSNDVSYSNHLTSTLQVPQAGESSVEVKEADLDVQTSIVAIEKAHSPNEIGRSTSNPAVRQRLLGQQQTT